MSMTALSDVQMTDLTIGAVVLFLLNFIVLVLMALSAWSLRRVVRDNDQSHQDIRREISALTESVAAEREDRHQSLSDISNRLWSVNADVKENYQTRREGMRLYGSLIRNLNAMGDRLEAKLDALPCMEAKCPGDHDRRDKTHA